MPDVNGALNDIVTRTFDYNNANQLEKVTSTADTAEQRLDYDDNGNLTTLGAYADSAATVPTQQEVYEWDAIEVPARCA
ncbi:MAG: hypothetical protein AAFU54_28905 [Chloroflexota bacterium]